jgi:hypothetical protein
METADTSRFQDAGQTIYDFGDEFLVHCPRCGQRAKVAPVAAAAESGATALFSPHRCVCPACGFIQEWRGKRLSIGRDAVDWYFGLRLWLQTPCCGHILWAYNAEHLAFLEAYIQATLREQRSVPNRNRALTSRLPLWMKRRQNRADVLKGIARLKRLLE